MAAAPLTAYGFRATTDSAGRRAVCLLELLTATQVVLGLGGLRWRHKLHLRALLVCIATTALLWCN